MRKKNGLKYLLDKVKVRITKNHEKCEQAMRISRTLKLIQPRDEAICFYYDLRTAFMVPRFREDFLRGTKVHIVVDYYENIQCKKVRKDYYVVCGDSCDPKEATHAERTARALAHKDKKQKLDEPAVTMVTCDRIPFQISEILTKQRSPLKMRYKLDIGYGSVRAQWGAMEEKLERAPSLVAVKGHSVSWRKEGRSRFTNTLGVNNGGSRRCRRVASEEVRKKKIRSLLTRLQHTTSNHEEEDENEDKWIPIVTTEDKKKKKNTQMAYPGAETLARLRYMITPKQKRLRRISNGKILPGELEAPSLEGMREFSIGKDSSEDDFPPLESRGVLSKKRGSVVGPKRYSIRMASMPVDTKKGPDDTVNALCPMGSNAHTRVRQEPMDATNRDAMNTSNVLLPSMAAGSLHSVDSSIYDDDCMLFLHSPSGKEAEPISISATTVNNTKRLVSEDFLQPTFTRRAPYSVRGTRGIPFLELNEYARACLGPHAFTTDLQTCCDR